MSDFITCLKLYSLKEKRKLTGETDSECNHHWVTCSQGKKRQYQGIAKNILSINSVG